MNIAILQLGTFGDLLLCTPVLPELKSKFPDSKVFFIVGRRNQQVLWNNPFVDKLIVWDKSIHKIFSTIYSLMENKFDFYIDPKDHLSRESLLIAKLVRANTKIGFNGKFKTFDIEIPDYISNKNLHFTQRVFQAFKTLGIVTPDRGNIPKPQLFPSKDSQQYAADFLMANQIDENKFVVLNISASNPKKMISEEVLISAFEGFPYTNELKVVVTFTPNHKSFALKISTTFPSFILFRSRNFLDVAALIEQSSGVVTPDTAMVHVASAFNKPLLAFYSGLDDFYAKFFPINQRTLVVRANAGDDGIQSITIPQITNSLIVFVKSIIDT